VSRERLAQPREIVFHNLVESVRDQFVVHIGEHIADPVVPLQHGFVEPEVRFAEVLKVENEDAVARVELRPVSSADVPVLLRILFRDHLAIVLPQHPF